jgi:hypothetical protein
MDRRQQIQGWLSLRDREGLTYRELSERVGVPANTLAHWSWRLRHEEPTAPSSEPEFVELIPSSAIRSDVADRVVIITRSKRRAIVPTSIDADALARIVSVLERC